MNMQFRFSIFDFRSLLSVALLVSLFGGLSLITNGAAAQTPTPIAIFSQADPKAGQGEAFVDLSPYVARELRENGRFDPIIYRSNLTAIRDAVNARTLTPSDVTEPIRKEAAQRIARVLGTTHLLIITGRLTKDGVAGSAEMDQLVGQQNWTMLFSEGLGAYRGKGKKPSVLEGMLAHAATIVQRLTGAPARVPTTEPISVKIGGTKPNTKKDTAAKPSTPDPTAVSGKEPVSNSDKQPPAVEPDKDIPKPPVQPTLTVSASELLAEKFRRQGDLANLIIALRKAVNEKPHDTKLRRELARAYLDRGWSASARDEAVRAIALNQDDASLHRLIGDVALAAGDPEAAVTAYQSAINLNGKDSASYVALGDAYAGLTHMDDAIKAYSSAAAVDPQSSVPHRRLAKVYAQKGEFEASVREMEIAKSVGAADDPSSQIGDFAEILGQLESTMRTAIAKQISIRKTLQNGSRTREQAFTDASEQKKRIEKLAAFLESVQSPPQLARVSALYSQAAGLAVQYSEAALQFIETQDSRRDEEAALLQVETSKQLDDAAKKLKAIISPKTSG